MSEFGTAFKTLKEARERMNLINNSNIVIPEVQIRKLSKKIFPNRTRRYHVGTEIDFLNFA